jgi:type I restriction enzyme S subunit
MGQAPKGSSYNHDGEGYALIAGAGDFGETTPASGKWTTVPTKISKLGDIILCIRATIGDCNWSDREYCLGRGVAGLRASNGKLDQRYLWHWLESSAADLKAKGRGATFLQVSKADIASLQIPLPPLAEQKRIAGILDAADALRAKRREALAQLDSFLQSTFLDMFGDPLKEGWEMVTVEDVVRNEKGAIRTGPFGSQLLHSEFVSEGVRVLGIDNAVANTFREGEPRFITLQKYETLRRYTVRPGDVLITIMGTCGRCAVVPEDIGVAINTKHLCCITLDEKKCHPQFMHAYFLQHPIARWYLERSAKGAIMSGLNMGIIKALPIPKPPLSLQHRFASIAESIERQKARMRAHLAELDALFASLQSRAFNGEL